MNLWIKYNCEKFGVFFKNTEIREANLEQAKFRTKNDLWKTWARDIFEGAVVLIFPMVELKFWNKSHL